MRHIALLLIPAALVVACLTTSEATADEECGAGVVCDAYGNDDLDAIEGRVLIPASGFEGDPGVRQEAATCDGCAWALTLSCAGNDEETTNGCTEAVTICPPPSLRYDILRRRPGETAFTYVGSTCIGPGTPLTVDELIPRVRDRFLELLPEQQPSFQPGDGALVQVPALFAAGQPRTIGRETFDLAGFTVVVTAQARWTWDFGDGTVRTFDVPGGAYPNDDVAHTYTSATDCEVVLTTTWDGDFLVDGLGPFPIGGPPVTQVSPPLLVPVRSAESELVSGP